MSKKVSIIMPLRNGLPFIKETLQSVQNQTYENWELLITNDYSTDGSLSFLNAIKTIEPRIKVFQNKGKGIISALNNSYKNAQGTYITRMDADDIMAPKKLEKLVSLLENHGEKHVAIGAVKYFSTDGVQDGFLRYEKWLNDLTKTGKNYQEIYKECVVPSPSWMMFKKDFDSIGGFNGDLYPEDYDLAFRMYENGIVVVPNAEILHYWRDHPSRASRNDKNYLDNTFFDLKVKYFKQLEHDSTKTTVLWGCGKKGKKLAKTLIENNISFRWICENKNKIAHEIYGVCIEQTKIISDKNTQQVIIAISNPDHQKGVAMKLEEIGFIPNKDYYSFC